MVLPEIIKPDFVTLLHHHGRFCHLRGGDGVKGECYGMIACEEWGIVFDCKMKAIKLNKK